MILEKYRLTHKISHFSVERFLNRTFTLRSYGAATATGLRLLVLLVEHENVVVSTGECRVILCYVMVYIIKRCVSFRSGCEMCITYLDGTVNRE